MVQYRMPFTPEKHREYQRERVRLRRLTWVTNNGPCAYCGSAEQLEVDHIDPSSKDPSLRGRNNLFSWSPQRAEIELAKCQALCHECHKKKTRSELMASEIVRGEKHPAAKLSDQQYADIREKHNLGESCASLAQQYGIHKRTAERIVYGDKRPSLDHQSRYNT